MIDAKKFPELHNILAAEGVSEYDRALVLGNRLAVNKAIQELDFGLRNLNAIDDDAIKAKVAMLNQALDLMKQYNSSMVDMGIS